MEFNAVKKNLILTGIFLVSFLTFSGCTQFKSYNPVTDVHDISGRKIGTVIGYTGDYVLSDMDDVDTWVYDQTYSMITALSYKRIDAVAVEAAECYEILSKVKGLKLFEEPFYYCEMFAVSSVQNHQWVEDFNNFLKRMKGTPKFEEFMQRYRDSTIKPYVPVEIDTNEGFKKIRVCFNETELPLAFLDLATGWSTGLDLEFLSWFSKECGYSLELMPMDMLSAEMAINSGKADVYVGGLSDIYRHEYELLDFVELTDSYAPSGVYLIGIDGDAVVRVEGDLTED